MKRPNCIIPRITSLFSSSEANCSDGSDDSDEEDIIIEKKNYRQNNHNNRDVYRYNTNLNISQKIKRRKIITKKTIGNNSHFSNPEIIYKKKKRRKLSQNNQQKHNLHVSNKSEEENKFKVGEFTRQLKMNIQPNNRYVRSIGNDVINNIRNEENILESKSLTKRLKKRVIKELTTYFNNLNTPYFKCISSIAGLTNKTLNDYIHDVPDNIKEYIDMYHFGNRERITFHIYKDLFFDIMDEFNRHESKIKKKSQQKRQLNTNTIIQLKKLYIQISNLKINIKQKNETIKNMKNAENSNESQLINKLRNEINSLNLTIQNMEETVDAKNGDDSDEEISDMIGNLMIRIGSISKRHYHRGKHMHQIQKTMNSITDRLKYINDDEEGEEMFIGASINEKQTNFEKIENVVYDVLREKLQPSKKSLFSDNDYFKNNFDVVLKDTIASQIDFALDKISGYLGYQKNLVIEDMIHNNSIRIQFSKYVSKLLNNEMFDESTRRNNGKYHASNYRKKYIEETNDLLRWFKKHFNRTRNQFNDNSRKLEEQYYDNNLQSLMHGFNRSHLK